MQDLMAYAGQLECYEACNEVLSKFLLVEVSVMQVYRVTDTYGGLLEQQIVKEETTEAPLDIKDGEAVYGMVDGSMVLTREEGWKEVKLGRMFKESECMEIGGERGWIRSSMYEAYLGGKKEFTRRFEQHLDRYQCLKDKLIFISDGAVWIKNWVTDAYPEATQILDWFHAMEHLGEFGKEYFEEDEQKRTWMAEQKDLLWESKVDEVIQHIAILPCHKKCIKTKKKELLQYFQSNKERMDYKRYRSMGAGIVGSGAIESAHRAVIQKRMKLSGQRWTRKGAQNMLTLRCVRSSGGWDKVINLICAPSKAA